MRKVLKARRNGIDKALKIGLDKKISEYIINSEYFKNARQVLLFSPSGSEFDTRYTAESCRSNGKTVYYPKCLDEDGQMRFFLVNNDSDLTEGMYDIREPREGCSEYTEQKGDIIIVPALSVDKDFVRIGYGKGYYDRFLKNFHGESICPCYDELRTERLPADEFDIRVDLVVTQSGLYKREVIL